MKKLWRFPNEQARQTRILVRFPIRANARPAMIAGGGRQLATEHFNSFLAQECVGVERFYADQIRKSYAPPLLRAVFLTPIIGDDPFTQQTFMSSEDNQPGEIAEAAEAAVAQHPDKTLVAVFYLTSLMVKNAETNEDKYMLLISGKANDGRTNGAIYFYEVDEDGRYYVKQDTIRPYDPESIANMEIRVPGIDAYFSAWNRAKLTAGGVK